VHLVVKGNKAFQVINERLLMPAEKRSKESNVSFTAKIKELGRRCAHISNKCRITLKSSYFKSTNTIKKRVEGEKKEMKSSH
jgi:hypothetical protein